MKVEVYWNLHKNCFSVRDCKTGRVIRHTNDMYLYDAKFVVRQAGRRKVLEEKRKNVHAFVRGYMAPESAQDTSDKPNGYATYNPYKYDTFVDYETKKPLDTASVVYLFRYGVNGKQKGAIQWVK